MPSKRPHPNWGQANRYMGPAGGKHTRSNKGHKGGCLDAVIIFGGSVAGLVYGVKELLG